MFRCPSVALSKKEVQCQSQRGERRRATIASASMWKHSSRTANRRGIAAAIPPQTWLKQCEGLLPHLAVRNTMNIIARRLLVCVVVSSIGLALLLWPRLPGLALAAGEPFPATGLLDSFNRANGAIG